MKFELKMRIGGDIDTKPRVFRLIVHDHHRRSEDTYVTKFQRGIVIVEVGDLFSIRLCLKGRKMDALDIKHRIRDRKNHRS